MDDYNLMAKLLMGHGEPLSSRLMSETLIRREPGPQMNVRAHMDAPRAMVEALAPDHKMSAWDRFNWVSTPEGGISLAANLIGGGGGGGPSMAVVPAAVARMLNVKKTLPQTAQFEAAVKNTPGASVSDDMLTLAVTRNQRPEQAMEESVRGGVFYLPQGSKDAKYYTGTNHNFTYGGTDRIQGETAVANPLFVKGATGGKAPEVAYDQLLGRGSYQAMRTEALRSTGAYNHGVPHDLKVEQAEKFLAKYAPEMVGLGEHILRNSTKGNQMAYALQEAAVASAARAAGHDSILGYSVRRSDKQPFISELFDVRENRYPSPSGGYGIWPQFKPPSP